MKHWITVHWPQREGEPFRQHVYLQDGLEDAGVDLSPGDLVFLYETAGAPISIRQGPEGPQRVPILAPGRQGIVAVVRLTSPLHERTTKPSDFVDRRTMWWRWIAEAEIVSTDGFVPREEVNEILGYKRTWKWRGFGDRQSGLRGITPDHYEQILAMFNENERPS